MKNLLRLRPTSGFTLVELLIVMAIVAIVASQVVPAMGGVITNSRKHSAISDLITLINLARNSAVQEQVAITLCPLDASNSCVADWSRPIAVFRDPARTKTLSDASQLIRLSSGLAGGRLIVKSGNRPYFRFRPTGMALEAIGNLVWCPPDNDETRAAQIRINMGGRPQLARDTNGDGVVEDAYGQAISCGA